jgi:cytochrome c oxidase subunit IV
MSMDAHAAHLEPEEYHEHHVPRGTYYAIFLALMGLTAATVGLAFVDLGSFNVTVALAVAVAKATLVVMFFMHVKYSSPLIKLVVLSAIVWLGFLLFITLSDYLTRGWLMAPPIVR